tara:strand:+ start:1024 stop:1149 length:126 start_codon:yes stop_codon:yes gene_type:complete
VKASWKIIKAVLRITMGLCICVETAGFSKIGKRFLRIGTGN